eukprot:COSAG01_NODE_11700_length_1877_cov_1.623735_3_plen_99_part_00
MYEPLHCAAASKCFASIDPTFDQSSALPGLADPSLGGLTACLQEDFTFAMATPPGGGAPAVFAWGCNDHPGRLGLVRFQWVVLRVRVKMMGWIIIRTD